MTCFAWRSAASCTTEVWKGEVRESLWGGDAQVCKASIPGPTGLVMLQHLSLETRPLSHLAGRLAPLHVGLLHLAAHNRRWWVHSSLLSCWQCDSVAGSPGAAAVNQRGQRRCPCKDFASTGIAFHREQCAAAPATACRELCHNAFAKPALLTQMHPPSLRSIGLRWPQAQPLCQLRPHL